MSTRSYTAAGAIVLGTKNTLLQLERAHEQANYHIIQKGEIPDGRCEMVTTQAFQVPYPDNINKLYSRYNPEKIYLCREKSLEGCLERDLQRAKRLPRVGMGVQRLFKESPPEIWQQLHKRDIHMLLGYEPFSSAVFQKNRSYDCADISFFAGRLDGDDILTGAKREVSEELNTIFPDAVWTPEFQNKMRIKYQCENVPLSYTLGWGKDHDKLQKIYILMIPDENLSFEWDETCQMFRLVNIFEF